MLKSTFKCEKCGKERKGFSPLTKVQIIIDYTNRFLCKSCSRKFKKEFERWLSDTKK